VSGPQRGRFILPGGGLGAHFGVPVPPAVQNGQKKGDGTPCRFLPACSFRYSNVRFRTAGFWFESETARIGAGFLPQVNDTVPNPNFICKGSDMRAMGKN
jgi:hypothetical protein